MVIFIHDPKGITNFFKDFILFEVCKNVMELTESTLIQYCIHVQGSESVLLEHKIWYMSFLSEKTLHNKVIHF